MVRVGDIVKIVYSNALIQLRLRELMSHNAVVTQVVYDQRKQVKGCFVVMKNGRYRGQEWFVPSQSIEGDASINRQRSIGILTQTRL